MAQEAGSPEPYTYVSFMGETLTLYPYTGRNVALLVPSPDLDKATLGRIVEAFDAAYDYYRRATGREPQLYYQYEGLSTIAVVPDTYGGGTGYLGATGIELMDNAGYSAWDILYEGVLNRNQFDQVTFYEFGRNFWFYGDEIEHKGRLENGGSLTTGYAVFMRFMAMDAAGVTPGPFNGISFDYFRSEVEGMLQRYLRDESLTWNNTLYADGGGRAPFNPIGLGNTDLFASFLFELRDLYGDTFIYRLWREVESRPAAGTSQEAADNFFLAASAAARRNLHVLFASWRWSVSYAAVAEANTRFGPAYDPYLWPSGSPDGRSARWAIRGEILGPKFIPR